MERDYQYNFSANASSVFDTTNRELKAKTIIAVLSEYFNKNTNKLCLLDVGASSGIIDNFLADHFLSVTGIDIDEPAIKHATSVYSKQNLKFHIGDALKLTFEDNCFDVVVCAHVYEHVPDANVMMKEIYRVLKPGGVCYFGASNRLRWNEPHYNLPLLSVVPRVTSHIYIRLAKKAQYYHELHFSYWGLKKLASGFILHDYTGKLIKDPAAYKVDYMLPPNSLKTKMAKYLFRFFPWITPSYIWLLEKP